MATTAISFAGALRAIAMACQGIQLIYSSQRSAFLFALLLLSLTYLPPYLIQLKTAINLLFLLGVS